MDRHAIAVALARDDGERAVIASGVCVGVVFSVIASEAKQSISNKTH
ncbi:hypothetical protein [Helicobacter canis]|nr:hypothetical protein [Helicobacter canis]